MNGGEQMKTFKIIILICIIVVLHACSSEEAAVPSTGYSEPVSSTSASAATVSSTSSTAAVTTAPENQDEDSFVFRVVVKTQSGTVKNGNTELVTYDISVPQPQASASGIPSDIASYICDYYIAKADDLEMYASEQLSELAKEYAEDFDGDFTPFGLYTYYEIMRNDGVLISVKRIVSESTGGAHPNNVCLSETFVSETGALLLLKDFFSVPASEYIEVITEYMLEECRRLESEKEYVFYDGYEADLKDNFNPNDFYLNDNGIVFFLQEYAIAPHAAGILEFELPYSEISDIINSGWLNK